MSVDLGFAPFCGSREREREKGGVGKNLKITCIVLYFVCTIVFYRTTEKARFTLTERQHYLLEWVRLNSLFCADFSAQVLRCI